MAIFVKTPCFNLYLVSLLLFIMSFALTSFAENSMDTNRAAALTSRVICELDGLQPMDSVYMSYQKSEFNIGGFSTSLQLTHHKVGRAIRLFENELVEVKWDLKDGLPDNETEYLNVKVLSREISSFDEFYQGRVINFYSDYATKPFTFEGTVKRIFAGGQIEVEWNSRNQKQKRDQLGISYWSASELRRKQNKNLGTVLPDQSKVLMALTSIERGSKKVVPDYLNMLRQIVLSRADAICLMSGFEGLASLPQVEQVDHHKGLEAYLPVGENLVGDIFYRKRPWTWSHIKVVSTGAAGLGILAGSVTVLVSGLILSPFTAGISGVAGIGAYFLMGFGGLGGLLSNGGVHGHLPYSRVLERIEGEKTVVLDFDRTGRKISPLVYKEIRCAATPEEHLKFDTSWIYESPELKVPNIGS